MLDLKRHYYRMESVEQRIVAASATPNRTHMLFDNLVQIAS
jgi:hypothetical protein